EEEEEEEQDGLDARAGCAQAARTLRHCLTSPRPMRSHGAANLEAIAAKLDRQEPRPRHVPPPCEAERAARASGPESWAKAPAAKGLRRQDVRATVPLRGVARFPSGP
ncbi:unnamed protein product, partial [Prorocentrum cordatum]